MQDRRTLLVGTAALAVSAALPVPAAALVEGGLVRKTKRQTDLVVPDPLIGDDEFLKCRIVLDDAYMIVWPRLTNLVVDEETKHLEAIYIYKTESPEYREFAVTYHQYRETGILPHLQFGGPVVAGKGDSTFYPRWLVNAREYSQKIVDGWRADYLGLDERDILSFR